MVGSESEIGSVLSWADEVEEEEAAALAEAQKPNPFGSARPREVVLQEKGIDWTKVDNNLQESSHLRHESHNKKPRRENTLAAAAPTENRGPKQKAEDTKLGGVPLLLFTAQKQIPVIFVPPLRYPPKIIVGRILQAEETNRLNSLDNGQQTFLYKSHLELEKENRFHEPENRKVQDQKRLGPSYNQQVFNIQRKSAAFGNTRGKSESKNIQQHGSERNAVQGRRWNPCNSGKDETDFQSINGNKAVRSGAKGNEEGNTGGCVGEMIQSQ